MLFWKWWWEGKIIWEKAYYQLCASEAQLWHRLCSDPLLRISVQVSCWDILGLGVNVLWAQDLGRLGASRPFSRLRGRRWQGFEGWPNAWSRLRETQNRDRDFRTKTKILMQTGGVSTPASSRIKSWNSTLIQGQSALWQWLRSAILAVSSGRK